MRNKLYCCIHHDFCEGVIKQWRNYLLFAAFILTGNLWMTERIISVRQVNPAVEKPAILDYVIGYFQGRYPYVLEGAQEKFEIPVLWLCMTIFVSAVMLRYPVEDYKDCGYQYITRSQSKFCWWSGKIVWCILSVFIYMGILWAVSICSAVAYGRFSLENGKVLNMEINQLYLADVPNSALWLQCMVLPCIVFCFQMIFQMVLSFLCSEVLSFIVSIIIFTASAYSTKIFLMGNYLMIKKNSLVIGKGGVETEIGIIAGIVGIIALWGAGYLLIQRKDIL